ncbi:hypothetical protein DPMN_009397 [Dreissena polymorpha]|uniref:Uncharacterized protein n=2 Tax=Dreissena polymorpha TaxID=45954 RepID=A0A9D4RY62_DREPO|nr:hypothetical protein DPMN_009397 [Dreissena polymorpha]
MEGTAIPKAAMRWTPIGRRKRGRPKETWRRSVEKEMRKENWSWGQMVKGPSALASFGGGHYRSICAKRIT